MLYERLSYVYNIFFLHAAPPTAPSYISIADIMSTQLTLLWMPSENSQRNGVVRSYLILLIVYIRKYLQAITLLETQPHSS